MTPVSSRVAVWVVMVISIGEISAHCGNTPNDLLAVANQIKACGDPIISTEFGKDLIRAITRQINNICSNVECRLSCMDGVIGNCDTTNDFYAMFDKQTLHVSYRGICANTRASINALTGCADALTTALIYKGCLTPFKSAIVQMAQYLQSGNDALYKQTVCRAMPDLAACMKLSPTGSCTATYAGFVNTFFKTSFTYATCGHTTTNQWFQDYSGPVNITGLPCGVSGVVPSTLFLAAMACFVALIKYMHT